MEGNMAEKASDLLKKLKRPSAADMMRDKGMPGLDKAVKGGGMAGAMGMTPAEYEGHKRRKKAEAEAEARRRAARNK